MTDRAERNSLFHPATPSGADAESLAGPVERDLTGAPLRSYIDDLRARLEALPDDDGALMVPPDARPERWIASNIETALHAAAETVPRSPSSPDSVIPPSMADAVLRPSMLPVGVLPPSMAPLSDAALRKVRRPQDDTVGRTAGEFAPVELRPLPLHERGRKSGRFVSPAAMPAASPSASHAAARDVQGPIASALIDLINEERTRTLTSASSTDQAVTTPVAMPVPTVNVTPEPLAVVPTASASVEPTYPAVVAHEPVTRAPVTDTVVMQAPLTDVVFNGTVDAAQESAATIALRAVLLFVTAWIAGGTTVYFLLRG